MIGSNDDELSVGEGLLWRIAFANASQKMRVEVNQDVSDKSSRHTPCAVRETVIRRGIR